MYRRTGAASLPPTALGGHRLSSTNMRQGNVSMDWWRVQGAHSPPSCLVQLVASHGQQHTLPDALVQEVYGNILVGHLANLLSQLPSHPGATRIQDLHKERLPQVFHCVGAMCG
jgi:hypothetical protein